MSDLFCLLYRVIYYIKAKYFYKIPWRELGFVHYIKDFTISRFTISSLGCTLIRRKATEKLGLSNDLSMIFFSIRLSDHPPYLYVAKHFHWEVKSNHKQKCLDSNHWNCQSINWYFIRSDFKINAMGWRYTCTTLLLRGSSIIEPIWDDLWERQIIENSLCMRILIYKIHSYFRRFSPFRNKEL